MIDISTRSYFRGFLGVALTTFSLVACSPDISCGTSDAKKLVDRLARDSYRNPMVPNPPEATRGVFTLSNIATAERGKNKTLCTANLHVRVTPGNDGVEQLWERDFKITYMVERTRDDDIYVTLDDF